MQNKPPLRAHRDAVPLSEQDSPPRVGGPMKAMSPGVVDYLFRQLVTGKSAEDVPWQREGITLSAQPAGAELARRLGETDLASLTPIELFHYVRASQRLASWAERLREDALERFCGPGAGFPGERDVPQRAGSPGTAREASQ